MLSHFVSQTGLVGCIFGMVVSFTCNAVMTEIVLDEAYALYFGFIFFSIGGIVLERLHIAYAFLH